MSFSEKGESHELDPSWPEGTTVLRVPIKPENMESLHLISLRHGWNMASALNYSIEVYRFVEDMLASGETLLGERADGKVYEIDLPDEPTPNLSPDDTLEA